MTAPSRPPVLQRVPLFPLPTAVLFPRALMPLFIFEPRYRALLRDALSGGRRIAMGLSEGDGVRTVCGVGSIARHDPHPDGTSHILLLGEFRARIASTEATGPYLTASLEALPETEPAGPVAADLRQLLEASAKSRTPLPLGALADLAAATLIADPFRRQQVLETLDPGARARLVAALLGAPAPRQAREWN